MKCRDCKYAKRGFFASVPEAYVCIGVKEPFVIYNYPDAVCSEYPKSHTGIIKPGPDKWATDYISDKYNSPINMLVGDMVTEYENGIFKAVQEVYTDINKDELIKALAYDRQQYEKGYSDGAKDMANRIKEVFREYMCGEIDDILKEMVKE